jgi:lipoprotein-releasing system ATP-binding protein
MLQVNDLCKAYPTAGEPLVVLRDLSLQMTPGENLAIIGPSGSGKSTFLQILGTLDSPTTGSVRLDGEDPFALDPVALSRFRNRQLGFVFQEHYLLPQLNVLENVLVPSLAGPAVDFEVRDRARELIERVGLADRWSHLPSELSGGERQRVAVARALLFRPPLLLADEPTGNLDRANAERIGTLLLELQRSDQSMLIVVTHSAALADRCGRIAELVDGRLDARRG